jgi:hypothetical protein
MERGYLYEDCGAVSGGYGTAADRQGISHFGGLIEGRMINQDRSALNAAAWIAKMDDEEAITTIIANAIAAPEGHLRLAKAEEFIIGEVERNRFNTERAVEIYTVAVDNSVGVDEGHDAREINVQGLPTKWPGQKIRN